MSTTTSTTYRVGETYRVAPKALTIGTNVRTDTHPGASDFAASIKARGVLEPITVWVGENGDLGRPGQQVDGDRAEELSLGLRDVGVAGTHDHVGGLVVHQAEGHGR